MELGKVKIVMARDELKNGEPEMQMEQIVGSIDMPVEDIIMRILHRMIREG